MYDNKIKNYFFHQKKFNQRNKKNCQYVQCASTNEVNSNFRQNCTAGNLYFALYSYICLIKHDDSIMH